MHVCDERRGHPRAWELRPGERHNGRLSIRGDVTARPDALRGVKWGVDLTFCVSRGRHLTRCGGWEANLRRSTAARIAFASTVRDGSSTARRQLDCQAELRVCWRRRSSGRRVICSLESARGVSAPILASCGARTCMGGMGMATKQTHSQRKPLLPSHRSFVALFLAPTCSPAASLCSPPGAATLASSFFPSFPFCNHSHITALGSRSLALLSDVSKLVLLVPPSSLCLTHIIPSLSTFCLCRRLWVCWTPADRLPARLLLPASTRVTATRSTPRSL